MSFEFLIKKRKQKMEDIKTIRTAICRNRGGHETTDDAGIMILWNALLPETQKQYIESIECKVQNVKRKVAEKE